MELSTYTLEATIVRGLVESDGDYHLVIQGKSGATMVAESPAPSRAHVGDTPWYKEILAVRQQLEARAVVSRQSESVPIRITGVGFFDIVHGQTGMAPSGLNLHPILKVDFLQ